MLSFQRSHLLAPGQDYFIGLAIALFRSYRKIYTARVLASQGQSILNLPTFLYLSKPTVECLRAGMLVNSYANGWSSRMQMSGQINAITHTRLIAEFLAE